MKTSSVIHETEVEIEPVIVKMNHKRKRVLLTKGLSVRPQRSLHKAKSLKPKTLLPNWLSRKDEAEAND